ncbi:MAG: diaminopimelate epimerase [bacterium]
MKFTKMNGIGNDYVYINCMENNMPSDIEDLAISLSNRNFGIGSDGIILIDKSDIADFKMNIYNADGSLAMMCGNGIRCVGKYVYDKKLTTKDVITIETLSGIKTLDLIIENNICIGAKVDMGAPIFNTNDFPKNDINEMSKVTVTINDTDYELNLVSMGNPHAVTFIENVDDLEIEKIGPMIENLDIFPNRINVEFIEVIDKDNIKMRVWERGSGETLACGTGSCASVVAAHNNNLINSKCNVSLIGGNLLIDYTEDTVFMSGPATTVFEGEM